LLSALGETPTTAYRGNDRDFAIGGDLCCESARVADVFLTEENVDVLPDLPLLIHDSVSNARVTSPQFHESIRQRSRRADDLHVALSAGEFTQGARNVKE